MAVENGKFEPPEGEQGEKLEKIIFWLFGVGLAVLWLLLFRWASHDPLHQGTLVLVTVLTAIGTCKCRDHRQENG
jgi:hypothetical protein